MMRFGPHILTTFIIHDGGRSAGGVGSSDQRLVLDAPEHALEHEPLAHDGVSFLGRLRYLLLLPLNVDHLLSQVSLEGGVHHVITLHTSSDGCRNKNIKVQGIFLVKVRESTLQ